MSSLSRPLLIRNSQFALLWGSQVVSQVGSRMFQIAVLWQLTIQQGEDSSLNLGIFLALSTLPALILVKKIGEWIDTYSSKLILMSADISGVTLAIVLAVILNGGTSSLGPLFVAGFLFALFQAFIEPTLNKSIPQLVVEKDTEKAVAFMSTTALLASFAGALFGALLIERIGLVGVTLLNGASFLFSVFCDARLRLKNPGQDPATADGGVPESGWKIAQGVPQLRSVLIGFAAVNFFGTPILMILPLLTKNILQREADTLALLESFVWLGLLSGTFLSEKLGLKNKTLKYCAISLTVFGLCLSLAGWFPTIFVLPTMLALGSFALGSMNVRMITYYHEVIPNSGKGRFFALLQALVTSMMPLAFFTFGLLGKVFPADQLLVFEGLGVLLISGFFWSLLREKRTHRPILKEVSS